MVALVPGLVYPIISLVQWSETSKLILEWDPWGVPDDYECEVIENDAPIPKHVPQHRPGPLPVEFYNTLEAVTSHPEKDTPAGTSSESQPKE
ncbi:putative NADH dehydrogenase [ubiquinone] 1 alpha subcomplex subunit 5, mitochondrial [Vitis vinifera]|uniref:Putative NADH dehydrogenase [ubiquinone] 1 alpha subcomplex subunit 5, mitochondrial n=1 Tax=Vitis vinifera TaxID=29760 RepID=A0A438IZ03_VITVI|nr:putative NADH dehydrogenase [ubiquinone] 1 alpha subcomplex subunit 5, mitochondrial [Vitis vinifera]RVX01930.1 putative NADH dehydrogenase [ubiquinone] 1 alpha subcomplex subunit 5, mitochondrial [Vitis vinifera]